MRSRDLVVRVALCGAVLASVATSTILWNLEADQAVPIGTLTNQTTELHYMIHAELRGAGPFDGTGGLLTASLVYTPQTPAATDATFHARLTSLTHPELPPIDDDNMLATNMALSDQYIDFQLWSGCAAGPCSEDFELTITRAPMVDLPSIDVGGTIHVDVRGNKSEAPAGTELVVEVTAVP